MKLEPTVHQYDIPDKYIENIKNIKSIYCDLEFNGLNILRDRLCTCQILLENKDGSMKLFLVHFPLAIYSKSKNLKKLLNYKPITKVFYFARLDLAYLNKYLKIKLKGAKIICLKIYDKMARTYTEFHGLANSARSLLGSVINKEQQSTYWGVDKLTDQQVKYAVEDVLHLPKLLEKLLFILVREKRLDLANKICSLLPVVVECDVKNFNIIDLINHH